MTRYVGLVAIALSGAVAAQQVPISCVATISSGDISVSFVLDERARTVGGQPATFSDRMIRWSDQVETPQGKITRDHTLDRYRAIYWLEAPPNGRFSTGPTVFRCIRTDIKHF